MYIYQKQNSNRSTAIYNKTTESISLYHFSCIYALKIWQPAMIYVICREREREREREDYRKNRCR